MHAVASAAAPPAPYHWHLSPEPGGDGSCSLPALHSGWERNADQQSNGRCLTPASAAPGSRFSLLWVVEQTSAGNSSCGSALPILPPPPLSICVPCCLLPSTPCVAGLGFSVDPASLPLRTFVPPARTLSPSWSMSCRGSSFQAHYRLLGHLSCPHLPVACLIHPHLFLRMRSTAFQSSDLFGDMHPFIVTGLGLPPQRLSVDCLVTSLRQPPGRRSLCCRSCWGCGGGYQHPTCWQWCKHGSQRRCSPYTPPTSQSVVRVTSGHSCRRREAALIPPHPEH